MSFGLRQSFGRLCKAQMARSEDARETEVELFQLRHFIETEAQIIQKLEELEILEQWQPDPQYRLQ